MNKKEKIKAILKETKCNFGELYGMKNPIPDGYDSFKQVQLTVAMSQVDLKMIYLMKVVKVGATSGFLMGVALGILNEFTGKSLNEILFFGLSIGCLCVWILSCMYLEKKGKEIIADTQYVREYEEALERLKLFSLGMWRRLGVQELQKELTEKLISRIKAVKSLQFYCSDIDDEVYLVKYSASRLHQVMVQFNLVEDPWDPLWEQTKVCDNKDDIQEIKKRLRQHNTSPDTHPWDIDSWVFDL